MAQIVTWIDDSATLRESPRCAAILFDRFHHARLSESACAGNECGSASDLEPEWGHGDPEDPPGFGAAPEVSLAPRLLFCHS